MSDPVRVGVLGLAVWLRVERERKLIAMNKRANELRVAHSLLGLVERKLAEAKNARDAHSVLELSGTREKIRRGIFALLQEGKPL